MGSNQVLGYAMQVLYCRHVLTYTLLEPTPSSSGTYPLFFSHRFTAMKGGGGPEIDNRGAREGWFRGEKWVSWSLR